MGEGEFIFPQISSACFGLALAGSCGCLLSNVDARTGLRARLTLTGWGLRRPLAYRVTGQWEQQGCVCMCVCSCVCVYMCVPTQSSVCQSVCPKSTSVASLFPSHVSTLALSCCPV
jgi:hypothetical protein